ncbi:hypothetical protein HK104_006148, partial [Borealophlyctis nickersoniae]
MTTFEKASEQAVESTGRDSGAPADTKAFSWAKLAKQALVDSPSSENLTVSSSQDASPAAETTSSEKPAGGVDGSSSGSVTGETPAAGSKALPTSTTAGSDATTQTSSERWGDMMDESVDSPAATEVEGSKKEKEASGEKPPVAPAPAVN